MVGNITVNFEELNFISSFNFEPVEFVIVRLNVSTQSKLIKNPPEVKFAPKFYYLSSLRDKFYVNCR